MALLTPPHPSNEPGVDRPAGQRAAARLVTDRSHADQTAVALESVTREVVAPPGASEVTGRVEQAYNTAPVGCRPAARLPLALDLWLRTTNRAAQRLDENPDPPLPPDEVYALEAVVRADCSRPSLLVRNGVVDPVEPLTAGWSGQLTVAGDALTRWPPAVIRGSTGFRVLDGAFVGFAAELAVRTCAVIRSWSHAVPGQGQPVRRTHAVLCIEPLPTDRRTLRTPHRHRRP
jgi:hypothetical protein